LSVSNENRVDEEELKELVQTIATEKLFVFKSDQISFKHDSLLTNGIVESKGDEIKVAVTQDFTEALYNHFLETFDFKLSDDFSSTFDFYNQVDKSLELRRVYQKGVTEQMSNLLRHLITETNRQFKVSFKDYALTLNKENEGSLLYKFNDGFSLSLPDLQIKAVDLYVILKHLYGQVADNTARWNLNVGALSKGVTKYCEARVSDGKSLLELALRDSEEYVVDITSAILIGLFIANRKDGSETVSDLAKIEKHQVAVVCSVAAIEPKSNKEAQLLLDVIDSIDSKDEHLLANLPRVYARFINNNNIDAESIKSNCFKRLSELVQSESVTAKRATLWELEFLKGYDESVYEIVNNLNDSILDEADLNLVCNVFSRFSEQKYFFLFLERYAEKNKLNFSAGNFESPISKFKREDPEIFSKHLIKLIIHDKGEVRFVGNRILSHVNTVMHDSFVFSADILELAAVDQYKLWVSILQESQEPKRSFPLLLPLRKSKYPFIVESFISKLEELVESYSSSVVQTLKAQLDPTDDHDAEVLARVELRQQEFAAYWDEKSKIKELNPSYTQAKIFEVYQENFGENMSRSMEDSMGSRNSFLDMITTVILAKGGGWKHQGSDQISELGTISTSFQLPRLYYVAPERFDYDNRVGYLKNWKNAFDEWEATISSLENT